MKLTRAQFLTACISAFTSVVALPSAFSSGFIAGNRRYVMGKDLDRSTFAPHLNTRFQVQSNPFSGVNLELVEVADQTGRSSGHKEAMNTNCFSLLFKGSKDPLLEQCTYEFNHNQIGTFHLFIVPIKQDNDGTYYQAVFNRLA